MDFENLPRKYMFNLGGAESNKRLYENTAHVVQEALILLLVSVVLCVPPLDLQQVGGRARPPEGARHLHVLAAVRGDVTGNLGEES
ncbi:hypothetical protein EYF80_035886 [Liparis tanakae]|uniref:Uncharacterized protein n=1 Tax=Liparis tanakae TaxID=230148 RepID=A0A4Z2GKR2_9TELE|nr:hypothetical protein EYF80_035886 [Liparis tanakae]